MAAVAAAPAVAPATNQNTAFMLNPTSRDAAREMPPYCWLDVQGSVCQLSADDD